MPRTRSLAWSELKVGVLSITAIVIAVVTIFMLTGGRGFFWQRYSLKTRFPNVAGLKAGSPVRLAGVEVGSVKSVDLTGEQVDVTFQVKESNRPNFGFNAGTGEYEDLVKAGIIDPALVAKTALINAASVAGPIAEVGAQANEGWSRRPSCSDIRDGRGTLGKLVTDEARTAR
jgi:hypothetical protein